MKEIVWINFFLSGWLIFTSWVMPAGVGANLMTRNDAAMAFVLAVLGCWTLVSASRRPLALWLQMVAGAWLIAAPYAFGYSAWNDVPCGVMAISIAVLGLPFATRSIAD